jgi:hypothetical protein
MLVIFVFDTTPSMNQRSGGFTFLDIAKGFVEEFVKIRQKEISLRRLSPDRYAIVTCQDGTASIRVSFSDGLQKFFSELKSMEAFDLGSLGGSLARAFELLNLRRAATGLDTYALGRSFWNVEAAMVMVLTDGGPTVSPDGLVQDTVLFLRVLLVSWTIR